MKLLDDWRDVAKRAWSLKLIGFAGLLELAKEVVPLMSDYLPWWATLLVLVTAGVARVLKQPDAVEVADANK